MRFLIDRCAGRRLADWLRAEGHDVVESSDLGPDPGDLSLLESANSDARVLITLDTDFGQLVFQQGIPHRGLIRLPDVPSTQRIQLMEDLLRRFSADIEARAVITIRGGRVRISRSTSNI
jgi:predicted nuclease of predicted toxin-antitoxin system